MDSLQSVPPSTSLDGLLRSRPNVDRVDKIIKKANEKNALPRPVKKFKGKIWKMLDNFYLSKVVSFSPEVRDSPGEEFFQRCGLRA